MLHDLRQPLFEALGVVIGIERACCGFEFVEFGFTSGKTGP